MIVRKQNNRIKNLEIKLSHAKARIYILEDINSEDEIPF